MSEIEIKKQDFAQTLARGLACLEALAAATNPQSVSEVATAMNVHRASARRILLTLQSLGYVSEHRGLYVSAPKVLALGRGMLGKSSLWSVVAPEVVGLADRLNEPCSISVLEGLDILFVCRDSTRRIYTARLGVGDRLPAHCTASGKVLLGSLPIADLDKRLKGVQLASYGPASITQTSSLKSALKDVRAKGFATAIDEMEDGTLSIAVPIKERGGRTIAAMSVATHRSRKTPADLTKNVLPALRLAVEGIQGTVQDFQDRNWTVF